MPSNKLSNLWSETLKILNKARSKGTYFDIRVADDDNLKVFQVIKGVETEIFDFHTTGEEGDITSVSAGVGLSGGGTAGEVSLALDASELTALGTAPAGGDFIVVQDITDNSTKKVTVSNLTSTIDADITSVVAGAGLTGGATEGAATLNVGAGTGITVNADDIAVDGVLEDLDTLGAAGSDGQFIVATGAGVFQYESGATARTSLGVDAAGTDNSTNVTIASGRDYITISGQELTLGQVDISDDTNLAASTGITLTGDTLTTNDSEIVHDNLSGFVANEHVDHSSVSITAGSGLTGGGDLTSTKTLNVGAGTGITVNADSIEIDSDGATLTTSNSDVGHILINDGGVFKRITPGNIDISSFNNDAGYTTETGDITEVTAGNGLTGGGTSGAVSLAVGAGTGIDVSSTQVSVDVSDFMSNGSNNRVVTATGADAMNAESNLEFNGSTLTVTGDANISGEVQTAKIAYTDGDDAITVEDGGYIKLNSGNRYSPSVKVANQTNVLANAWVKVASTPSGFDSAHTSETTFLVSFVGREYHTAYDGDASFIINVKHTYYSSSPYYYSTGTRVTCEPVNGSNLNSFDPATDVVLTVGSAGAELWVASKENYKTCFASILGGTDNNDASYYDQAMVINTGQSFASSVTSLGTDIAGVWADKTFNDVTAASLDISGDVDVDGTLEADAITVNGTALDTHIAGVTVTNATSATTATNATNVATTTDTGNATHYITYVDSNTAGNQALHTDANLQYNPSTDILATRNMSLSATTTATTTLAVGGDLGLADSSTIKRIAIEAGSGNNAFLGFGEDNTKRGWIGWDGGTENLTIATAGYDDTLNAKAGRVGINEVSPAAMLTIKHDGDISEADPGGVTLRLGGSDENASNNSSRIEMMEDGDSDKRMKYGFFINYDGDAAGSRGNGAVDLGMRNNSLTDTNVIRINRDAIANAVTVNDTGVGIGHSDASWRLRVYDDRSGNFCAYFQNDGNNSDRHGIAIQNGSDAGSGTNTAIQFRDGNGTNVGAVNFSGGTVTYGAFTGDHYVRFTDNSILDMEYGTIIKIDRTSSPKMKSVQYWVSTCAGAKEKAVLGVYNTHMRDAPEEEERDMHSIFCLGDGHILVCSEGGDIEIGDYICSSNTEGHGMKQDDDLLHGYTVAKASEAVIWENEDSSTKLITCTYHCG